MKFIEITFKERDINLVAESLFNYNMDLSPTKVKNGRCADSFWDSDKILSYKDTGITTLNLKFINSFIKNNRERHINGQLVILPLINDTDTLKIVGFSPIYHKDGIWIGMFDIDHFVNKILKSIIRNEIIDNFMLNK